MAESASSPSCIGDYALIGDCETAALVDRTGSIDWLCWPRFDSDACFCALLGDRSHGHWRIAPAGPYRVSRRYLPSSLVLETLFETEHGAVALIDFMPPRSETSDIVRIVEGRRGHVDLRMDLVLRFGYGRTIPWVTRLDDGSGLRAIAGPSQVLLRTAVETRGEDMTTVAEFRAESGKVFSFVLSHQASHLPPVSAISPKRAYRQTLKFWRDWIGCAKVDGRYAEPVERSLMTLKALTFAPTGGLVAAPTTSLPEQLGGPRTWDYRFCWIRDATLTLLALMNAGYFEEASAWRDWLQRAIAGSPGDMQIMYGIGGERRLAEWTADWLPGYRLSLIHI